MSECCATCKYCRRIGYRYYCYGEKYAPRVDPDECCDEWKPQLETNAEWLQGLTVNDLAEYLQNVQELGPVMTKRDWLNWLKSLRDDENNLKGDDTNV